MNQKKKKKQKNATAANQKEIQQHFISIPPLVWNVIPGIWRPFGANQWG